MKDYNYWIKAIERDILEPDKIHIHLGHLKQSLLNSGYPLLADGWRETSNPPVRPDDYIIAVRLKRGGWGVYEQTYLGGEWMDNDKPDFWQPLPLPPNVS